MEGYIVLCDHNTKWAEKFIEEAQKRQIYVDIIENIEDEEMRLMNNGRHEMLICSAEELKEYLKSSKKKLSDISIFFEKVNVFVISDSNSDKAEINFMRKGCIDYQWRKRNIYVILERIVAYINKMKQNELIIVNTRELSMIYSGEKINLNKHETDILKLLYKADGVLCAEDICSEIWEKKDTRTKATLHNAIYRLRKKMPDSGKCIQSIYGRGLILSKDDIRMII